MNKKIKIGLITVAVLLMGWFAPIPDFVAYKIGMDGSYKESTVGIAAIKPFQYYRYEILESISSTKKLQSLYLNHSSPAVKCYAFKALLNKTGIDHFELLKIGMADEREIPTHRGCFFGSSKVGDILINEAREHLKSKDARVLDSLILYSPNGLDEKKSLLIRIEPKEKYYPQILNLAKNPSHPEAIVALSRFQKLKDTNIINLANSNSSNLYYYLLAIQHFPLPSFEMDLLDIQEQSLSESIWLPPIETMTLYQSLIRINSPVIKDHLLSVIIAHDTLSNLDSHLDGLSSSNMDETLGILELSDSLRKLKSNMYYHNEAIYRALTEFENPYYQELLPQVRIEDWQKREFQREIEWSKE